MICGVDEAGKGPVIGPLVVAAVKVKNAKDIENLGIKDSKQLTPAKRKELAKIIKNKFSFAVEIIEALSTPPSTNATVLFLFLIQKSLGIYSRSTM